MVRLVRLSVIVAAALSAATIAYAGGNEGMRLTLEQPRAAVRVIAGPEAAVEDSALQVRIGTIDNPSMTPFGIVVRLAGGGEIGRFAIYPADQTGDYYISLKPAERAALAEGGGVMLEIDRIGEPEGPLSVIVELVRLR